MGLFLGLAAGLCLMGQGQIAFEPKELELGELRVGQTPTVRLTFWNRGKTSALPARLETSCGCLAAGELPKNLEPDQHATVELRLRTLSLPTGPHAWRVRLTYAPDASKPEENTEVETRLVATVRRELEVEPAIMALSLGAGGEAEALVKVKDLREKPLKVTGFTSTVQGLLVRQATGATGQGEQIVKVSVRGDQVGRSEGVVRLGTNDPEFPVLEVPVTVTVRPRQLIRCSPERVELRGLSGTAVSRLVRIERGDGKIAEVATVKGGENAGLACRHASGNANSPAATLRVEATVPLGESLVQLEVALSDGTTTRLPVILVGE